MIFAIPIASYVEYVSLEELRKSKYTETKKIREWLKEELPGYNFGLVEGLKEIFVYSKGREANEILMIKMNEMKRKEIVANPMSFISFIKSRSEYTNHTKSEWCVKSYIQALQRQVEDNLISRSVYPSPFCLHRNLRLVVVLFTNFPYLCFPSLFHILVQIVNHFSQAFPWFFISHLGIRILNGWGIFLFLVLFVILGFMFRIRSSGKLNELVFDFSNIFFHDFIEAESKVI